VDTDVAIENLEKLGFVGLTDEWTLSVCLWHAKFGGNVLPAELVNVRPGVITSSTGGVQKYNRHQLLGHWYPEADTRLYQAASKRFWKEISLYGVDRKRCENASDDSDGDDPSLIDINPIHYLHVPETGSGFATTIAHHACGDVIPSNLSVEEPKDFLKTWGGKCDRSRFLQFQSGHSPLNSSVDRSHVVAMFRDPPQRIVSGYYNDYHDCWRLRKKYNCTLDQFSGKYKCAGDSVSADGRFLRNPKFASPVEYGRCVENCTVNMLTGRQCGDAGEAHIVRAEESIEELGFVGLSEEWALSVCLWHRKFGGRVLPVELNNARPGVMTAASGAATKYNIHALLGDWRPTLDVRVYEAATRRFWREISEFGIDGDLCEEEAAALLTATASEEAVATAPRSYEIGPIHYVHVPRTGSGLSTTIAHHTCGDNISSDVWIREPSEFFKKWDSTCSRSRFHRFQSGHSPLNRTEIAVRNAVVMFRDPSQRVISAYYSGLEECWELRKKYNCRPSTREGEYICDGDRRLKSGSSLRNTEVIPLEEYGRCIENCTANILTGRQCGANGSVDVRRALGVIDKLAFVGLTEEWELSVCLWHKRFGGSILPVELMNVRPGVLRSGEGRMTPYDARSLLGTWRPQADSKVYDKVVRRFWQDVESHGVSRSACEKDIQEAFESAPPSTNIRSWGSLTEPGSFFNINPIRYLHIPQSGSGLATVVAHHACGARVPHADAVIEPDVFLAEAGSRCSLSDFGRFQSGNDPISAKDAADMEHVVMMIREPSQRILSGYFHDLHDCADLQQKHNCRTFAGQVVCDGDVNAADGKVLRNPDSISPIDYGKCVANCTANMLIGRPCGEPGPLDVGRAVRAINDLGFVGLTDEWALSVCLWHKRFGGRMRPVEFQDTRRGVVGKAEGRIYDEHALLGHWRPEADDRVYEAASSRFWREIEYFGVDRDACELEAKHLVALDAANLSSISSINYLHIPRSGSGFATTIAHHVCEKDIPENLQVLEPKDFLSDWGKSCDRSKFGRFQSGHEPLDSKEAENTVVMIRDPSQRILSGYYADLHDCWALRKKHNCSWSGIDSKFKCDGDIVVGDAHYLRDPDVISPVEYGMCVENCTTNMLAGLPCSYSGPVDVQRALDAVDQLGFVGLTEEWDLSVCLWHKKFGGKMLTAELMNMRPGVVSTISDEEIKYDDRELFGHWAPDADLRVFEAATRRFWSEIEHHGVDREECARDTKALKENLTRSDNIEPIEYLHIPQSGSGFATVVAHHACTVGVPDSVAVDEPTEFMKTYGKYCDRSKIGQFKTGHNPMHSRRKSGTKHVVAMIRDPSQRVLSGYYNDLHDCPAIQEKYNCKEFGAGRHLKCDGDTQMDDGRFMRDPAVIRPTEYARCVSNCTANMLTGKDCGDPGPVDADRAVELVDKLGFVGLTDEWALSLCLWHKRFGGRVLTAEVTKMRPGIVSTLTGGLGSYDYHSLLGHWRSEADERVFEAAARRFWRDVLHYGIDRDECEADVRAASGQAAIANVAEEASHTAEDVLTNPRDESNMTDPLRDLPPAAASTVGLNRGDINPIYYLHVPGSGPGFATTVVHQACGSDIPDDLWVREPGDFFEMWSSKCDKSRFARFETGHVPLSGLEDDQLGHVVVMVRDPSQRVLSGYYHDLHDCWDLRRKHGCKVSDSGHYTCDGDIEMDDGRVLRNPDVISPVEYGKCVENCTSNMLTGRFCGDSGPADVQRAMSVIDQLGFVGLADEWALSLCLWHKRFGGQLLPAELMSMRPEEVDGSKSSEHYDPDTLLGHWVPEGDSQVFQVAARRFWMEVMMFGVDRKACEQEVRKLMGET
jgi:hypothetical protein